MKTLRLQPPLGLDFLAFVDEPDVAVQPGTVKVAWKALSLNFHDYLVVTGVLPTEPGRIPMSDASGEVVEVGAGVTEWQVGDRVISTFLPDWSDGPPSASTAARWGGDACDGYARQVGLVDPRRVTRAPAHLSHGESATLPCAAVTAWRALVEECRVRPGDRVLIEGTGGTSLFALQIAKLLGAVVYATTSTEEKAEHLRKLGADHVFNYRSDPAWGESIARHSGGGVEHVIDIGAGSTLTQSIAAAGFDATICIVGILGGPQVETDVFPLIARQIKLRAIAVGSHRMQAAMVRAFEAAELRPVVDSTFPMDRLADAFGRLTSPEHFGKIVVELG